MDAPFSLNSEDEIGRDMEENKKSCFVTVYQVWVKRHHDSKWKMHHIYNDLADARNEVKRYTWDGCADCFIIEVQSFVFDK